MMFSALAPTSSLATPHPHTPTPTHTYPLSQKAAPPCHPPCNAQSISQSVRRSVSQEATWLQPTAHALPHGLQFHLPPACCRLEASTVPCEWPAHAQCTHPTNQCVPALACSNPAVVSRECGACTRRQLEAPANRAGGPRMPGLCTRPPGVYGPVMLTYPITLPPTLHAPILQLCSRGPARHAQGRGRDGDQTYHAGGPRMPEPGDHV
jgi:hypothetical protein